MKLRGNGAGLFGGLMVAGFLLVLGGCSGGGSDAPTPSPILAPSVTLTVAKVGNGAVTSTSGINCGASCTVTVSSGTVVTLNAAPQPGNTLTDWGGACTAGSASCALTITTNQTVTATFSPSSTNPALGFTVAGTGTGSVTCNGGQCTSNYPWGTSVTLAGAPNGNSSFAGWSGGGCTGTAVCTLVLWADTQITATFNLLPVTAQLSVSKNGTGAGTVASNPVGLNCGATCLANFSGGAVVTLTATPAVNSTFIGWTGGGCAGTGTCVVTMNANVTVTATFNAVPPTVTLTTTTGGTGAGTITCNGGVCNPSYPSGTALTIAASPSATSLFGGWGGACASAGTATSCSLTMNANSTVSATFNLPTLSVVLAGTGSVTSSPAGLNCGATCTASFNKGTSVTLTAAGAGFSGWSGGGCSGTGTCVVTLNQNTSVTATFGGGGVSGSARYHFFMRPNGPLMAVDPASPSATPTTVASIVSSSISVFSSTWDPSTTSFPTIQYVYQVYASNGRLWRVNAAKSSGVPGSATNLPVQISNESAATQVCTFNVVDDVSNPSARRMFYELPGADAQCGGLSGGTAADNITKYVSLSDGAATAPTVLGTGLSLPLDRRFVYDLSSGIATHMFLINAANGNTLSVMNLATQVITPIQANIGDISISVQDTSSRVFVYSIATNTLYLYTLSSNILTPLVTGVGFEGGLTSDGINFFVANYTTGTVYRVPLNATTAGQVVPILNAGGQIYSFLATTNRVYVVAPVGLSDSKVISVAKSGGASREDVPAAPGQISPQAFNGLFYFSRTVFSPTGVTSSSTAVLNESGTTIATFPNAGLAGYVGASSYNVRGLGNLFGKLLLSTYVGGVLNGGTMTAVDGATGTPTATIGTVPPSVPNVDLMFFASSIGDAALGLGVFSHNPAAGPVFPVFFMDAAVPNSLVQVPAAAGFWEVLE